MSQENVEIVRRAWEQWQRSDETLDSGEFVERDLFHLWTFRDGMIVKWRVFETREQAFEAAGLRSRRGTSGDLGALPLPRLRGIRRSYTENWVE
jgi:hypothetical protein